MSKKYEDGFTSQELSAVVKIVSGQAAKRPRWKDEITVQTHDISVIAGWTGLPQCVPHHEEAAGPYQPIPGWGILEVSITVVSNSNGGHETAVLAGGGKFIAESDLDFSYSFAIDVAVKAGKADIEAKLKQEYSEHRNSRRVWEANANTYYVKASAKAHGDCVTQKRGWHHVVASAKLVYIGEPNGTELLRNLIEDNGLMGSAENIFKNIENERNRFKIDK